MTISGQPSAVNLAQVNHPLDMLLFPPLALQCIETRSFLLCNETWAVWCRRWSR